MDSSHFDEGIPESAYDDPIQLLEAIKYQQERSHSSDGNALQTTYAFPNNVQIVTSTHSPSGNLKSIQDIASEYGLTTERIISKLAADAIHITAYLPLFDESEISKLLSSCSKTDSTLYDKFLKELLNMRTQYSYKPLLVLALLKCGGVSTPSKMDDIMSFYFRYYDSRRTVGLMVEKENSYFVRYWHNAAKAKETILRYPVKIYQDKNYIRYDSTNDTITFNPVISENISPESYGQICQYCQNALDRYYTSIL